MKLYVMRHGQATPASGFDMAADANRPLTDAGRRQVIEVITRRKSDLADVDLVLASPYLRARQTAQLVIDQLDVGLQLLISESLAPGSTPREALGFIDQLEVDAILVASHMPLVGHLIETLTADDGLRVMGTAWLVALETEAPVPGFAGQVWLEKPGD